MVFSNLELSDIDVRASQPDKIITKLKPHQLTSLYKAMMMENTGDITYKIKDFHTYSHLFYENSNIINPEIDETEITIKTNIGILGDKVGYGKTLLGLALIASNKLDNIHINPIYVRNFASPHHYNYLNHLRIINFDLRNIYIYTLCYQLIYFYKLNLNIGLIFLYNHLIK